MDFDLGQFALQHVFVTIGIGIFGWLAVRAARRGAVPSGELDDGHSPRWYALVTRVRRGTFVPDHAGILSLVGSVLSFVPTGAAQPLWSVDARTLEVEVLKKASNGLTRVRLRGPGVGDLWVALADRPLRKRMWQLGAGQEFEVRTARGADDLTHALFQVGVFVRR